MSQPGESQRPHPLLGDSSADTSGVGHPAPPSAGREEHPKGSPPPSPVPGDGSLAAGQGGVTAQKSFSSGGSGPVPCSAASSGLWSLILGTSVRKEAGAGSPRPPPVPAQRPSPWPLGILLPGVSVSPECVPGILGISPLSLGGPHRSPAWAPPPQAVLVSRKGRVKALSRKNEAEQSKEQGQQPEGCTRRDTSSSHHGLLV